ncbi:unnamed protein product [Ambrosiozyma monospora]|uniref:Unnamed protein product n=1 Tax=Ambrosiozyma monospora TaxID=43982 RepID=A0A9W6YPE1_AMBMO|nr:unnamed protein product [Ambrosiozyma monospora]
MDRPRLTGHQRPKDLKKSLDLIGSELSEFLNESNENTDSPLDYNSFVSLSESSSRPRSKRSSLTPEAVQELNKDDETPPPVPPHRPFKPLSRSSTNEGLSSHSPSSSRRGSTQSPNLSRRGSTQSPKSQPKVPSNRPRKVTPLANETDSVEQFQFPKPESATASPKAPPHDETKPIIPSTRPTTASPKAPPHDDTKPVIPSTRPTTASPRAPPHDDTKPVIPSSRPGKRSSPPTGSSSISAESGRTPPPAASPAAVSTPTKLPMSRPNSSFDETPPFLPPTTSTPHVPRSRPVRKAPVPEDLKKEVVPKTIDTKPDVEEHIAQKNDIKKEELVVPTSPSPVTATTEITAVQKHEQFIPIVPSKRPHKKPAAVSSPASTPESVFKNTDSSLSASKELKEDDLFSAPPKITSARPARQSSSSSVASTSSLLDIYGNESEDNSMIAEDEDDIEQKGVSQVPAGSNGVDVGDQTVLEDSVTDQSDVSGLENKTQSFSKHDSIVEKEESNVIPSRVLDDLEGDDDGALFSEVKNRTYCPTTG